MPAAYGNRPAPFAFAGFDAAAPGCDGGAGGVVCAFLEPTQGLVFEHDVSRTKTLSLSPSFLPAPSARHGSAPRR